MIILATLRIKAKTEFVYYKMICVGDIFLGLLLYFLIYVFYNFINCFLILQM